MVVGGTAVPRGRGRVVMLVDNGVEGDSRGQKTARSAADAGWDVVLLGLAPHGVPRQWQLGEAQVRLLPLTGPPAPTSCAAGDARASTAAAAVGAPAAADPQAPVGAGHGASRGL